jgi:hypothetical protein
MVHKLLVVSLLIEGIVFKIARTFSGVKTMVFLMVGLGDDSKVLFMESVVAVGAMFVFFLYFSQYFAPIC